MKTFSINPKIYFSTNALNYLSKLKCRKALVIADPFMVKSLTINKITDQLDKTEIEYTVFSDIVPDSPIDKHRSSS